MIIIPDIMKASTPIAIVSPENNDFNTHLFANFTRTLLPRKGFLYRGIIERATYRSANLSL